MVARLDFWSVSLAQKPKSAGARLATFDEYVARWALTDLDVPTSIKQHVVALNITVDDVLAMEMSETFACLVLC